MTQHEQKPESAEFRTRDKQVQDMANSMSEWLDVPTSVHVEYAGEQIAEAEARFAAEQRRKDAEGAVAWVDPRFLPSSDYPWTDARLQLEDGARGEIPLYTRPANVAALEARVKELEGEVERLKKPEFYSVEDQETGWCDLESLMESLDGDVPYFEPVEIDCFRSVPKIWAFYDGNKVHEFATEDEARAASAAAIREGEQP